MYITHLWGIHVALFLTGILNFARILKSQNQSVVNALFYILFHALYLSRQKQHRHRTLQR